MRGTRKFFALVCLLGLGAGMFFGCGDTSTERRSSEERNSGRDEIVRSNEEAADDFERELEDITDDLERNIERNQEDLERIQEKIEDKLDRHLNEEEIEKLRREIEHSVQTGLAAVGETLEKIGARLKEDSKVTVVDYREFKELVPQSVAGFEMDSQDGSNKSALGIRFSQLESHYTDDNGSTLEIAIIDLGTMKGLTAMGFDWVDRKIDNEDSNGFEKTTKFGGYPGFESAQYDGTQTATQGVAIVENRFVVSVDVKGENIDKGILTDIFDDFSFRRLRRLAN